MDTAYDIFHFGNFLDRHGASRGQPELSGAIGILEVNQLRIVYKHQRWGIVAMNLRRTTKWWMLVFLLCLSARAKSDPFTNLDFEKGTINVPFGSPDSTEVLIPGWTLIFDDNVFPWMLAGSPAAGIPTAWLADRGFIAGNVIQGRFSVGLFPGFTSPSDPRHLADYGLSQRGDVPAGSESLRFQVNWGGLFDVRLDGVSLDLVDESPTDLWFAADIKQFAGRNVLLEFYTQISLGTGGAAYLLDTIEFSPDPVIPEPSAIGMVACGLGVLLLFRRSGT
ncbi:MAG: hypothetical protein AB7O66_16880 [Limisphaerales bacterium]